MKRLIVLILLMATIFEADAMHCKKKKKRTRKSRSSASTNTKTAENSGTLIVSFISIGSGIDYRKVPEFETSLKDFNLKNKCNLDYQIKHWGREGEKDYCLTSSDANCLKNFTASIQEKFKGNERILIKENAKCRE